MKDIKIKGWVKTSTIQIYESADELTAVRGNEFHKLVTRDWQGGMGVDDLGQHFNKLHTMLNTGITDGVNTALTNMHYCLFNTISGVDIKSYAVLACVHSINGVTYNDLSEHGTQYAHKLLMKTGIKQKHVAEILNDLKKKFLAALGAPFLNASDVRERLPWN